MCLDPKSTISAPCQFNPGFQVLVPPCRFSGWRSRHGTYKLGVCFCFGNTAPCWKQFWYCLSTSADPQCSPFWTGRGSVCECVSVFTPPPPPHAALFLSVLAGGLKIPITQIHTLNTHTHTLNTPWLPLMHCLMCVGSVSGQRPPPHLTSSFHLFVTTSHLYIQR